MAKNNVELFGLAVYERMLSFDNDIGGNSIEIQGAPGSAKTAFMLMMIEHIMQLRPNDKIFFSSTFNSPVQFTKLEPSHWVILVEKGSGITFRDRDNKMKLVNPPVTYFTDFQDCFDKAIPGKCNAVFFEDRKFWLPFMSFLRQDIPDWKHVFIDEMHEVAPEQPEGAQRKLLNVFKDDVAEMRKSMMTFCYNTQTHSDIYWPIRTKMMFTVTLPGGKEVKDGMVKQAAINRLERSPTLGNQAYLEMKGSFGKKRAKIFKPKRGYNFQACPREDGFKKYIEIINEMNDGRNR
jgi:hypothetical protein